MRHVFAKDISRESQVSAGHKRIFIACEDYKTEVSYFTKLLENSERLGLYGRVEVVILNRYHPERGISDPIRVAEMCRDHMRFLETGECTRELFASAVLNSVGEDNRPLVREMLSDPELSKYFPDGWNASDIIGAQEFAVSFMANRGVDCTIIMDRKEYYRDNDEVYLVVDRDGGRERPPEKYVRFLEFCEEQGFGQIVTNPQFEFWLLMHEEDPGDDLEAIAASVNPAATLKRCMKARGIRKDEPDFEKLIPRLDKAMANAEGYIFQASELVSKVGTRMPMLISAMRDE